MKKDTALLVAGLIFALVTIAHVLRLYFQLDINVSGTEIPQWVSISGAAVAGLLTVWMFLARRG